MHILAREFESGAVGWASTIASGPVIYTTSCLILLIAARYLYAACWSNNTRRSQDDGLGGEKASESLRGANLDSRYQSMPREKRCRFHSSDALPRHCCLVLIPPIMVKSACPSAQPLAGITRGTMTTERCSFPEIQTPET
jgi:hypothetical protein